MKYIWTSMASYFLGLCVCFGAPEAPLAVSEIQAPLSLKKVADGLPKDAPTATSVIHDPAFTEAGRGRVGVSLTQLAGDKMLSTYGVSSVFQYFFSEQMGTEVGGAIYRSEANDDLRQVEELGLSPVAYDPRRAIWVGGIYQPTYGKLLIFDYIQHFKLGIKGGLKYAQQKVINSQSSETFAVIGPHIGGQATFPFGENLSFRFDASHFIHAKNKNIDGTKGLRKEWTFSLGIGLTL